MPEAQWRNERKNVGSRIARYCRKGVVVREAAQFSRTQVELFKVQKTLLI